MSSSTAWCMAIEEQQQRTRSGNEEKRERDAKVTGRASNKDKKMQLCHCAIECSCTTYLLI
jgi:hypothetical protein